MWEIKKSLLKILWEITKVLYLENSVYNKIKFTSIHHILSSVPLQCINIMCIYTLIIQWTCEHCINTRVIYYACTGIPPSTSYTFPDICMHPFHALHSCVFHITFHSLETGTYNLGMYMYINSLLFWYNVYKCLYYGCRYLISVYTHIKCRYA